MWKLIFSVLVIVAVSTVTLGSLVGGFTEISKDDPRALSALNYAVVQHNRGTNSLFLSQVAEVVKVESQVVSGMNYRITVKMGRTPCRKDRVNEVCAIHQDPEKAQAYQCTFTVWVRPWLTDTQVIRQEC